MDTVTTATQQTERGWRSAALWLLLLWSAFFVFGNPHLYGEKGNGRYLLPVLRSLDGELFAQDPMVDGMERFRSLFYEGAGFLLKLARVDPEQLETVWGWGYGLSRLALVAGLLMVAMSLGRGLWPGAWLLAWAAHPKATFVGSTALFVPALGHDTVAFLLCLGALAMILHGLSGPVWLTLSLALLVHPLLAGHCLLVMVPSWMWIEYGRGRLWHHLPGWGAVLASAFIYWIHGAPPRMDAAAAKLFLDAESASPHVSLFTQPSLGWLKMILTIALAWYGSRRLLTGDDRCRLLVSAMLWGSLLAGALSTLATATGSVVLTQLQPLRVFTWVLFLAVLLIAWITAVAWREDPPLTLALAGWLAFSILGSLWSWGFLVLALITLAVRSTSKPFVSSKGIRFLQLGLLIAIIGAWLLGEHQPFLSLRDPAGLLPTAMLFAWTLWPRGRFDHRASFVMVLLAVVLWVASWRAHVEAATKDNPSWDAATTWIRHHTAKDAIFLTLPGAPDFRFNAWRTSRSEPVSALTWVAPKVFDEARELALQVASARRDGVWSVERLRTIAAACGAGYALVDGPYEPAVEPLFANRDYAVISLAQNATQAVGEVP